MLSHFNYYSVVSKYYYYYYYYDDVCMCVASSGIFYSATGVADF